MRSTSIAEFKARLGTYLGLLAKGPLVVTRHGRPRAVVLPVPADPEDLDGLLIGFDPRFWEMIDRSDRAKAIPEDEFWRRAEALYGPYPKKKRPRKKARRRTDRSK